MSNPTFHFNTIINSAKKNTRRRKRVSRFREMARHAQVAKLTKKRFTMALAATTRYSATSRRVGDLSSHFYLFLF